MTHSSRSSHFGCVFYALSAAALFVAMISLVLLDDLPSLRFAVAAGLMIAGFWFHLMGRHGHDYNRDDLKGEAQTPLRQGQPISLTFTTVITTEHGQSGDIKQSVPPTND